MADLSVDERLQELERDRVVRDAHGFPLVTPPPLLPPQLPNPDSLAGQKMAKDEAHRAAQLAEARAREESIREEQRQQERALEDARAERQRLWDGNADARRAARREIDQLKPALATARREYVRLRGRIAELREVLDLYRPEVD